MTRNLETLIQQFNQAKELDRHFEFEGQPYWLEVDGVRTRMIDAWFNELSSEEKAIFKAYITKISNEVTKALGYDDTRALFEDVGKKLLSGLKLGINNTI